MRSSMRRITELRRGMSRFCSGRRKQTEFGRVHGGDFRRGYGVVAGWIRVGVGADRGGVVATGNGGRSDGRAALYQRRTQLCGRATNSQRQADFFAVVWTA